MEDSEEVTQQPDELAELIANPISSINLKIAIFLFCIFLFVSSNVFIDQFLKKFEGVTKEGQLTSKAIIIQGMALVLLYILAEMLITYDLL